MTMKNTPICIIYKKAGLTVKTEYYLKGKEVPFNLFKQKIKRMNPPQITIKNIEDEKDKRNNKRK